MKRTQAHSFAPVRARTAQALPFWLLYSLLGLTLVLALAASTAAQARSAPDSFADLVEKLAPAVINVRTAQKVAAGAPRPNVPMPQLPPGSPFEDFFKDFFDRQRPNGENQRRVTSVGSGFIVSPDGFVITNNHVIDGADEIVVIMADKTELKAKVVGRDPKTDVAVMKVEASKPLPHVKWGNSDDARVGDWVIAIGNPLGLGGSVTAGIVSARGRDINSGPYDDFIQTDASINKGNSGGPLFNLKGEVIGINTAIFSQSGGSIGIGFAVPESLARPVASQLIKYGRIRRGWLGVQIQHVTEEIAEGLGLSEAHGALVASVLEGGPAKASGIKAGDVILEFNGREIREMRNLPRIVADTEVNVAVKVKVWRQGEEQILDVTIGEMKDEEPVVASAGDEAPPSTSSALGMTLSAITPELRERFELGEDIKGVVVTEVEAGSAAAEKGIGPGAVILEVSHDAVQTPADVSKLVEEIKKSEKQKSVLLRMSQSNNIRFVVVPVDKG